jgi:integrase/recombinase XerD
MTKLRRAHLALARDLARGGASTRRIARQLGVDESTLRYRLGRGAHEAGRRSGRATPLDRWSTCIDQVLVTLGDLRGSSAGTSRIGTRRIMEMLVRVHGFTGSRYALHRHLARIARQSARSSGRSISDGSYSSVEEDLAESLDLHIIGMEASGYAQDTQCARHRHLRRFIGWCAREDVGSFGEITPEVVERYMQRLHAGELGEGASGPVSRAHALTAVRRFLGWAVRTRRTDRNSAADVTIQRPPQRLPRYVLTAAEAAEVLRQADLRTAAGIRDRAIMEVLYSTGVRRSELVGLDVTDLDRGRGVVIVRLGKGGRDRRVPIGDRALLWVEYYLSEVRPVESGFIESGALFLTTRGSRMRPSRLTDRLHRYLKSAGIGKEGSCHIWRHTAATLMHEGGAGIRDIQEFLGHVQLNSTQIYTHVSGHRLKAVHSETHPARLTGEKLNEVRSLPKRSTGKEEKGYSPGTKFGADS